MNWFSRLFVRDQAEQKSFTINGSFSGLGRTDHSDTITLTTLDRSSAVQACVRPVIGTWPEAPLAVKRKRGESVEDVPAHPLLLLLDQPNDIYDGDTLFGATISSFLIDGNAYWYLQREGSRVAAIYHLAPSAVTPKGKAGVEYYDYAVNGVQKRLAREDVIHFRDSIDPNDPRLGVSPLKSAFREVLTDSEITSYSHHILQNLGVPGLIAWPKNAEYEFDEDSAKELSHVLNNTFSKKNRGKAAAFSTALEIWSPTVDTAKMALPDLRRLTEERIAAVMRIPRIIAGLGPEPTYSNYETAQELFWENVILPLQRKFVKTLAPLADQYLAENEWLEYCTDDIRALQEDIDKTHERIRLDYQSGLITRAEARTDLGMDSTPADDVYFQDAVSGFGGPLPSGKGLISKAVRDQRKAMRQLDGDGPADAATI